MFFNHLRSAQAARAEFVRAEQKIRARQRRGIVREEFRVARIQIKDGFQ